MVLIGALAAIGGIFIVAPFRAADDMVQRAALVDQAQLVLARINREVRTALPNSVRVSGGGSALEFVSTITGGRYRRLPASDGSGNVLDLSAQDTFDVLGGLPGITAIPKPGVAGTSCASATTSYFCISIYNTGQKGFSGYDGDNIAAITQWDNNAPPTADTLTYDTGAAGAPPPPAFAAHSPRQRFFVIDTVVSYVCANGKLKRYSDYGLHGTQPVPPSASGELVAADVSTCTFTYQAGTAKRQGLLTTTIGLTRGGETITLFTQTHVLNAP